MEHVIEDLRRTAHECRAFSDGFDFEDLEGLGLRKGTELLAEASQIVLAIHKRILSVHYQQLEAISQHHPEDVLPSKFGEVLELLKLPASSRDNGEEDDDDQEDNYDFFAAIVSFGVTILPAVAERLEYIAAHLGALAARADVHNVTITNSKVGAVATGARAQALGRQTSTHSSRKAGR